MTKFATLSLSTVLVMSLSLASSCNSPTTKSTQESEKTAQYEKTHEKFSNSISKADFVKTRLIWDKVRSAKRIDAEDFDYIAKLCTEPYSETDNIGFVRTQAGATFTIPADFTEEQEREIQKISLSMLKDENEMTVRAGLAILRDRRDPIGKAVAVPLTQDKREGVAEGAKRYLEAIGVKEVE